MRTSLWMMDEEGNAHQLIFRHHFNMLADFNMFPVLLNWKDCNIICKSTRVDYK